MNLSNIIRISRPPGYIIGPLIFFIPILLFDININFIIILQAFLLSFPFCFLLFGMNDISDIESDIMNPRKSRSNFIEGHLLDKKDIPYILNISTVSALLMFVPSLISPNILNLISTTLLIFFAYFYSTPPVRLKEKPLLDSLSNAVIIYLIFLIGLSYGPGFAGFPGKVYYLLFGVMAIHIFSTIMDFTPDKESSTITFSTIFGKRLAALLSFLIFAFIFFFSGIKSIIINLFIVASAVISAIELVRPDEKQARYLFSLIFILFAITICAFIFTIL